MEKLRNWFENVVIYPTNEIFYQITGKKENKKEQRLQELIEPIFKYNFKDGDKNCLGSLRASYREFEVMYNLGMSGVNEEYIKKVSKELLTDVKDMITLMDNTYKKDPALQEHYLKFKLKYQEINSIVYDLTKEYLKPKEDSQ